MKRTSSRRMRTGERTASSLLLRAGKPRAMYLGIRMKSLWLFFVWQQARKRGKRIGSNIMLGWATEPRAAHAISIRDQFKDPRWRRVER